MRSIIELHFTTLSYGLRSIEVNSEKYEEISKYGKIIDGSSLGMAPIEKSDLILKPINETLVKLPWNNNVSRVLCDIYSPIGKLEEYGKEIECKYSPRYILKNNLKKLNELGYFLNASAEMEFFIIKNEKPIDEAGYLSPSPIDKSLKIREEIYNALSSFQIGVEYLHHEVSKGQSEICLNYDNAINMADKIQTFKYIAKNIVENNGFEITFMPKPFKDMNGNGMHIHLSLSYLNGKNAFYDKKNTLSKIAKNFIGGILEHAKSLAALAAPTINSYKRLVPGYEAPTNICWGPINRSALIRIPYFFNEKSSRIELRMPDPCCNPYLIFAGIIAAGIDGIEKEKDPGEPTYENVYKKIGIYETLPKNLNEALNELTKDGILKNAIDNEVLNKYIEIKRKEWNEYIEIYGEWNPYEITEWEKRKYFNLI
jgi:glutamine synthetase